MPISMPIRPLPSPIANNSTGRSLPYDSATPIHPSLPLYKMPRSAVDATRFTATMPHAHSKTPHISASPRTMPSPNRPKETPQEKVARLKAAARRAKAGNISTFDRIVVRGRVWADRAHRIVTLSLVGLTGPFLPLCAPIPAKHVD